MSTLSYLNTHWDSHKETRLRQEVALFQFSHWVQKAAVELEKNLKRQESLINDCAASSDTMQVIFVSRYDIIGTHMKTVFIGNNYS